MKNRKIITKLTIVRAIIYACLLYIIIIFIVNWPILIGTDYMKWDNWDLEYPLQVIFSDIIKSGRVPEWIPLMNFGTPSYAMVGIPVWYPVTLLLNLIGYTPISLAVDHCVHILIGSMGMFLLVYTTPNSVDIKKDDQSKFIAALCAGMFYGFSGCFVSNAEHISIIISAAWVPYSLLFSRKFIKQQKVSYVMSCAFFSSMIFLGGYPEVFYDLFLVLIPWMIYWELLGTGHHSTKEIMKMIFKVFRQFIELAIFTMTCSAISLIPFIKIIPQITRGNGQNPLSPPLIELLSMLLPVGIDKVSGFEISMGMFYIGFFTIIAVPFAVKKTKKNNQSIFFFVMFLVTLYSCFGKKSLVHMFLYKFAPMYSSFRFPTLFRIFYCIFGILFVKDVWEDVICESIDKKAVLNWLRILLLLSVSILGVLVVNYVISPQMVTFCKEIIPSSIILVIFCIVYIVTYYLNNRYYWNVNARGLAFLVIAIAEVVVINGEAFPITSAQYNYFDYFIDENVKKDVTSKMDNYTSRNKSCDFSNNSRSNSNLNSEYIMHNKTFDEEGYICIKLSKIEQYKSSYNRSIIQQQPEIFFTDDVVCEDDVNLSQWLNMSNTSPNEIHIGTIDNQLKYTNSKEYIEPKVVEEDELQTVKTEGGVKAIGPFMADSEHAVKIRLYFSGENQQEKELNVRFKDGSNNFSNYKCSYTARSKGNQEYIDISFPSCDVNYSTVEISGDSLPTSISLVKLERATTDSHICVNEFGCNKISMNVNAPTDGIVTVLQSNYDGWDVLVDGEKTDITEVDGCFIGIPVTKGTHDVELEFKPLDFVIGATITFAYLALLIIALIIDKRKTDKLVCSKNNNTANRG